jgi:Fe-S oxidoreductase
VEEALDLCLACKGCKSDCPVNVDMATYKAEFRAHHYKERLRPRAAYSMGRIHDVARIASTLPGLFNALTRGRAFSGISKYIAAVDARRTMPPLARETFTAWFRRRRNGRHSGPRVLLFPDTFNNYFRPETAIAATRALEAAGFQVTVPKADLCCGRPLYDWGWLAKAKSLWEKTFKVLQQEIGEGTPVIGLEPACLSAFRDELPNLFPNHRSAEQLSKQAVFFSDFLADHGTATTCGVVHESKALVQIHCHQHAIIKPNGEQKLLDRLSLDYRLLPSGCCGMAGSFGFERGKYDMSQQLAERVLLPAVRGASVDTAILANGFSCREQIEQATSRKTLHIAELVAQRVAAEDVP